MIDSKRVQEDKAYYAKLIRIGLADGTPIEEIVDSIIFDIRTEWKPEETFPLWALEAWAEDHDFVHRDDVKTFYNHKDEA